MGLAVFTARAGDSNLPPSQSEAPRKGRQTATIDNTVPRRDANGQIIDAHDGCLQLFGPHFYLYGTAYGTNTGYTAANRFVVYTSPDLQEWAPAGQLLADPPKGVYYRPYVVFNPTTHRYVLWYNWYPDQWNGQTGVAVSDTPVGPFTIVSTNVLLSCAHAGDGSLFVDDDGTGYYIYTAIDRGYAVRVERLTPDYLHATGETSHLFVLGAEAPVLFRREDLYYVFCGPRCAFCPEGSEVLVYISISPTGPFKRCSNFNRQMESAAPTVVTQSTVSVSGPKGDFNYALNSKATSQNNAPIIPAQETWVAKIPTTNGPAFIWMADRWQSTPDGIKGHDFQFWSPPLSFNSYTHAVLPLKDSSRWSLTLSLDGR